MDLAEKHAADFRSIVQSDWYRRAFPQMRIKRVADSDVFTTMAGYRRATSIGGRFTGLGGNLFIIDDPQKPIDVLSDSLRNTTNQWFSNTLLSRLDNKATGAIIVVMQRLHLNDLTGHLTENSKDWTVLSLPAIAEIDEDIPIGNGKRHHRRAGEALHPERESIEVLEKFRSENIPEVFAAQYQQAPVPLGGAMIKREWLRYYDQLPERTYKAKIIQSWDTASKPGVQNDYSVCTTWLLVDGHYYLMDLIRGRFEYPQLRGTAIAQAQRHKPHVILIEDTSSGPALAHELKKVVSQPVLLIKVEHNKAVRLFVQGEKFVTGKVLFPKGASFLPELETELLSFPQGKTDDQVDSISQALAHEPYVFDYANV
jgi:predicted phage terminase large subunit-like protein